MAEAEANVPLLPLVRELLEDFAIAPDGEVSLPDEKVTEWADRLTEVPAAQREEHAVQIVAVAREFAKELKEKSVPIVAPLAFLVSSLLGPGAAREAFENQALEFNTTWLGGSSDKRPVGSTPAPEGAVSPLQVRLPSKTPTKKKTKRDSRRKKKR